MSDGLRSYQDRLGYLLLIASAIGIILFHLLPSFAIRVHSEANLETAYGWEISLLATYRMAEGARVEGDSFQILGYWLLPIALALFGPLLIKPPRPTPSLES